MKISTGTKDDAAAERAWPDVLRRWQELRDEWERRLNVVRLTPETAAEIAAHWAAWIAADLERLQGDPKDAFALDTGPEGKIALILLEDVTGAQAAAMALLAGCAAEAAKLAGIMVAPETQRHLLKAMRPVVVAAYRQANHRDNGIVTAVGDRWNPLRAARDALPLVPDAKPPARPKVSVGALYDSWKAITTAKPRTQAADSCRDALHPRSAGEVHRAR